MSLDLCDKLGIRALSQVIKEELHPQFQPFIQSDQQDRVNELNQLITSTEFATGVLHVLMYVKSHMIVESDMASLNHTIIHSTLSQYKITCVQALQTRFIFKPTNTDVTAQSEGSLSFVDESKKVIFVAQLPNLVTLEQILSIDLCNILKIRTALPLSSILTCRRPSDVIPTLQYLKMIGNYSAEIGRGEPGQLLTAGDKQLIKYSPLHYFLPDEIVAWQDAQGQLRYGIVVNTSGTGVDGEEQEQR
jgi:hypothetical protein